MQFMCFRYCKNANCQKTIPVCFKEFFASVRDDVLYRALHRADAVSLEIY